MDFVIQPDDCKYELSFFLAEEEYLARYYPERDFFFTWQVAPTVIIGRNQLLFKEVDLDFCNENSIDIIRRKSGGGAVYADWNNIMFSYICTSENVTGTFSFYTSMIANALKELGLEAENNTRNDILISGRKVSGNSYYHNRGRSIVHGTMLYDYDPDMMSHALRPAAEKLRSHGVESVRSRVTTIREHLPQMKLGDFNAFMVKKLTGNGNDLVLSRRDIEAIKEIEQEYKDSAWLNGKNPKGSLNYSKRFDGVGEISVNLTVDGGIISEICLSGDYFENGDASAIISSSLKGINYDRSSVRASISNLKIPKLIPELSSEDFLDLFF